MTDVVKCPYCAEEISAEARKCKHCGEFLTPELRSQAQQAPNSILARTPGQEFVGLAKLLVIAGGIIAVVIVYLLVRGSL